MLNSSRSSRHPTAAFGNWKRWALGLGLLVQASAARADVVNRHPSETDNHFMTRVLGPSVELAQKVVRSTEIAEGRVTLIGFENHEGKMRVGQDLVEDDSLVGHLLIEMSPGRYEHVTFPSCGEEGGAPELLAVFFARTSNHAGRDLAVRCGWDEMHAVAEGRCYSARFYRLNIKGPKIIVVPVAELNKRLDTCDLEAEDRRGKLVRSRAKFRTVRGVRRLLTRMGIKQ